MRKSSVVAGDFLLLLSLFALVSGVQAAGQYPEKPIVFIVPVEAGADADILSRPLCQKASTILGQPILIVNKPGAGSSIGYREVHDAKPDGYTIGMGHVTLITNKMQGLLPYNHHDFSLMGTYYRFGFNVFASTKTKRPFKTIQEAISFAKSNPGEMSIATAAVGQGIWFATMIFITGTGIQANVIPQAGAGGLVVVQAAGGHTDLGIGPLPSARTQLEAGNLRFLVVLGSERFPRYKDVPTLKEIGYNIEPWESFGIVMGPPNLPKDISDKLAKAFEVAANDPDYKKFVLERFVTPFYLPPDKIKQFCDERKTLVGSIMDKAGILKEK